MITISSKLAFELAMALPPTAPGVVVSAARATRFPNDADADAFAVPSPVVQVSGGVPGELWKHGVPVPLLTATVAEETALANAGITLRAAVMINARLM